MPRSVWLAPFAALSVAAVGLAVPLAATPGATIHPPIIRSAVMQAAKGSHVADAIKLTYSTDIRHALQTKAPFPFQVEGYTVTSVKAATGTTKTLTVSVAKRTVSDLTVTPFVTYTPPAKDPVKSLKGSVKAAAQTFIGTVAVAPATAIYVATTGKDTNPGT